MAFGNITPNIVMPHARRLHCNDPRLIHNFNNRLRAFFDKHNLIKRYTTLLEETSYPASTSVKTMYEVLDTIRVAGVKEAEQHCRKLKMGQVAFSPKLQEASVSIYAWTLLMNKAIGGKVSSRLISRTLRKANLAPSARGLDLATCHANLHSARKDYYSIRASAPELRVKHLDALAEALAKEGNVTKEKILRQLKQREQLRSSHQKIKYIRGKLQRNTTTTVTIMGEGGRPVELTKKLDIEQAILKENQEKFQQSFHSPFYQPPINCDFGYKALTPLASQVLSGSYIPPASCPESLLTYLSALRTPPGVKGSVKEREFIITLDEHITFWRHAKEFTSCYPAEMSFATMRAGAHDSNIAALDCMVANIPLLGGFTPLRWRKCLDVMIPKKAGVTLLSGLQTIVLFPVDTNYVFKFIGRKMMRGAEASKSLAPEQYSSRKGYRAIDLATCKTLTYDLLRQLKRPGAICSNDAKSCYDLIGHPQASLSMQRVGVPRFAVDCMFSTLQLARHQVRTGFGDSTGTFGGPPFSKPIHGIGQGNGAGPAIWAVVSSPLLDRLRASGLVPNLSAPSLSLLRLSSGMLLSMTPIWWLLN
jgi:hypothetical protein